MRDSMKIASLARKLKTTGFMHIFGAGVINQIAAFFSGVILVRIISKSDYGVFSYTNNILSFFLLASGFGAIAGILQICSENYRNVDLSDSTYRFGVRYSFGINLILSMVIVIFSLLIDLPIKGANQLLLLLSITPIITIINELISIYLRYKRKNKAFSFYSTANTILVLLFATIGAFVWSTKGLILFRYIGFGLSIIIGIVILKFPLKSALSKSYIEPGQRKDFIKISTISMVNNATAHLLFIVDIFILGLIIPDESIIASYKVATLIPNALVFIPNSLMVYAYPYFAEHNKDTNWVKEKYAMILKYFGIFNIIISAFLIIFAPLIIKVVFGNQYLDAVLPFRILSAAYFITSTFRKVSGNLLVTQRKLRFNFGLGLMEGVLNIIMNIVFISLLGSVGASISSLIAVTVTSILSTTYFMKVINRSDNKVPIS